MRKVAEKKNSVGPKKPWKKEEFLHLDDFASSVGLKKMICLQTGCQCSSVQMITFIMHLYKQTFNFYVNCDY